MYDDYEGALTVPATWSLQYLPAPPQREDETAHCEQDSKERPAQQQMEVQTCERQPNKDLQCVKLEVHLHQVLHNGIAAPRFIL
jgi:hypothetical protein